MRCKIQLRDNKEMKGEALIALSSMIDSIHRNHGKRGRSSRDELGHFGCFLVNVLNLEDKSVIVEFRGRFCTCVPFAAMSGRRACVVQPDRPGSSV